MVSDSPSEPAHYDNDTTPPERCEVVIDTPRLSFTKRRDDGVVDFVAPLPSPFNYGSVPGTRSGDGDRVDAIVLGPRLHPGSRHEVEVYGVARFVDAGADDPKWICKLGRPTFAERMQLEAFFRVYAVFKRSINSARGRGGETRYDGFAAGTSRSMTPGNSRFR
jgi:inorganic pyrophosphatase